MAVALAFVDIVSRGREMEVICVWVCCITRKLAYVFYAGSRWDWVYWLSVSAVVSSSPSYPFSSDVVSNKATEVQRLLCCILGGGGAFEEQ